MKTDGILSKIISIYPTDNGLLCRRVHDRLQQTYFRYGIGMSIDGALVRLAYSEWTDEFVEAHVEHFEHERTLSMKCLNQSYDKMYHIDTIVTLHRQFHNLDQMCTIIRKRMNLKKAYDEAFGPKDTSVKKKFIVQTKTNPKTTKTKNNNKYKA